MKKVLLLASALTLLSSLPARAEINVYLDTPEPVVSAPVVVEPAPVYVEHPYPARIDHHHHYDWKYWRERQEHEHHDHDRDHDHDDHHDHDYR